VQVSLELTVTQRDPLDVFLIELSKFSDTFRTISVKTVAQKHESKWMNMSTLVALSDTTDIGETKRDLFGESLTIVSQVMPFARDRLEKLIRSVAETKSIPVADIEVSLEGTGEFSIESYQRRLRVYGDYIEVSNWPLIALHGHGRTIGNYFKDGEVPRNLEEALKKRAYSDLEDLTRSFLGYGLTINHRSSFTAYFPVYASITNLELTHKGSVAGTLTLHPAIDPSEIQLSAIVYSSSRGVPLRTTDAEKKPTGEEAGFKLFEFRTSSNIENTTYAVLYAFAKGSRFLDVTVYRPEIIERLNPFLKAHKFFDPDLSYLREGLKGLGKDLEEYVSILLHLSGFSIEYLGGVEARTGSRRIDILAFSRDRKHALTIECVGKNLDPEDVTEIAERVRGLTAEFKGMAIEVHGLYITSLPSDQIPGSVKERALKDNVKIVDGGLLLKILDYVEQGKGDSEVLKLILESYDWSYLPV